MIPAGRAQKLEFFSVLLSEARDGAWWTVCVLGSSGLGPITF